MRPKASGPYSRPARLSSHHDISTFDCGRAELNEFLRRYALQNQSAGATRTFVVQREGRVVGYHSLAAASVQHAEAPARVRQGLATGRAIGVVLLARLAVDRSEQGQGLGQALLKDAFLRAVRASDDIGVRALLVHAKDESARRFYEHFNFEASPTDALHLFLLMKEMRAWVNAVEGGGGGATPP